MDDKANPSQDASMQKLEQFEDKARQPSQKPKTPKPDKSGKGKTLLVIAAAVLTVICASVAGLVCCSSSKRAPAPVPVMAQPNYKGLAENWNQYARAYPPRFSLFGDRGGTDANILAALNSWLAAFSARPSVEYTAELARMKQEYGETSFHAWEDFRKAHYRRNPLELNSRMKQTQIAETINNYIGVSSAKNPQDYISAETVRAIVYMNSLCAFFEGELENLHKSGIDGKIHECGNLATNGEYPALDALLR